MQNIESSHVEKNIESLHVYIIIRRLRYKIPNYIKKKKGMRTTRGVERGPARQTLDVDKHEDTAEV